MIPNIEYISEDPAEDNSYIQTQFFFYLLPCYYAIVAFSIRYRAIMKEAPQRDVDQLPGESILAGFEEVLQNLPGTQDQPPPASYVLKSKLCLINSYIYLFMTVFSLIGTPSIFYACKHKAYSPVYLVGFLAWSFSAVLLRREYRRNFTQSLWTHRFFWIFSGTFAITKMFEDYLLPFNIILNAISIATNIVLAIYGLYRPEDNDTIELIHNEEIPFFVKKFFEFIQLNVWVRKLFRIKQLQNRLLKDEIEYIENINEGDLIELQNKFKVTAQTRRQQIKLLNTLPRRNIYIDKKVQYVKAPNGSLKYYYFIITQIGLNRFEANREITEFQSLEKIMQLTFNDKNFPQLILPKLKLSSIERMQGNEADNLEEWLGNILKKPVFMIKPFLQFLSIDSQNSAPFIAYFQFSYRSFCSKHYILTQLSRNRESQSRHSLIGYFEEERETVRMNNFIKQKLSFKVTVNTDITDPNEYGFKFSCIREDPTKEKITWNLTKGPENIEQLNPRIEEQCKVSVPAYYKMLSTLSHQKHSAKAEIYKAYIEELISNQKYYCPSLFQFLRFDPISIEVKMLGGRIQLSSRNLVSNNERCSHYMQEYEDDGNFIEVLRVDKTESQESRYQFKIKRNHFIINKSQADIMRLRRQLSQIYEGVSFVARIQLKGCSKREAKKKLENFLSSIQSLPYIKSNKSFSAFYEHMLT